MRHISYFQFINKLFTLLILTCILSGSFAVKAQTAKTTKKSAARTKSDEGWSGTITYLKTLEDSFSSIDNKTIPPVTHEESRNHRYSGNVVFTSSNGNISSNADLFIREDEFYRGIAGAITRCHSHENTRIVNEETVRKRTAHSAASGPARDFHLTIGHGVFSFGFKFPRSRGETRKETNITHMNYCFGSAPAPPPLVQELDYIVDSQSVDIEGRIDPRTPDLIVGAKSWGGEKQNGIATYKITVTWELKRNSSRAKGKQGLN